MFRTFTIGCVLVLSCQFLFFAIELLPPTKWRHLHHFISSLLETHFSDRGYNMYVCIWYSNSQIN